MERIVSSVWQTCSDESDRSWRIYQWNKHRVKLLQKHSDAWKICSEKSDKSWQLYLLKKQQARIMDQDNADTANTQM
jgi:hypothetical protein